MRNNYVEYTPKRAICPGETISEAIETLNSTESIFAESLEMSEEAFKELLQGKLPITEEIATNLQQLTGTPAHIWLALERQYQEVLKQQAYIL